MSLLGPHRVITSDSTLNVDQVGTFTALYYVVGGTCDEFQFNWGDGSTDDWEPSTTDTHSWSTEGSYAVVARGRDSSTGDESGWSPVPCQVTVVRMSIEPIFDIGFKCFKKDTQIVMADQSTKNIQDIQIGDKIISYNTATNSFTTDIVLSLIHI